MFIFQGFLYFLIYFYFGMYNNALLLDDIIDFQINPSSNDKVFSESSNINESDLKILEMIIHYKVEDVKNIFDSDVWKSYIEDCISIYNSCEWGMSNHNHHMINFEFNSKKFTSILTHSHKHGIYNANFFCKPDLSDVYVEQFHILHSNRQDNLNDRIVKNDHLRIIFAQQRLINLFLTKPQLIYCNLPSGIFGDQIWNYNIPLKAIKLANKLI